MTDAAGGQADGFSAWGPESAFGLAVAVITTIVDQGSKLWLLGGLHLDSVGRVVVTPFLDLVLTWNTGISYGWLQNINLWVLLTFKIAAVVFLWVWLSRAQSRLTALALGLIIGGAVGNAMDPLHWRGVMDFVYLHGEIGGRNLSWYSFNLADVAIVAGVVGLLYESLQRGNAAKAP